MSALKADAVAIWPDVLHAKGLAAGRGVQGAPSPGRRTLTFCHLSCAGSHSASGTSASTAARKSSYGL